MKDKKTYRGLVFSKFHSISDFARGTGWSRNKASRIVNGLQEPNSDDIADMVRVFEISSQEDFMEIFFAELSTKWTIESRPRAGRE